MSQIVGQDGTRAVLKVPTLVLTSCKADAVDNGKISWTWTMDVRVLAEINRRLNECATHAEKNEVLRGWFAIHVIELLERANEVMQMTRSSS